MVEKSVRNFIRVDSVRIRGYGYADMRIRIRGYGYADTDMRIPIRGYGYADTDTWIRIRGYGYADTRIRIRGYGYGVYGVRDVHDEEVNGNARGTVWAFRCRGR